jgi:outer membrane protein insertion porin family
LLSRSKGVNPIFPTYGSEFSISAKLTAPYSLINGTDYATLDKEAYKLKNTVNRNNQLDANGNTVAIGDYIDGRK